MPGWAVIPAIRVRDFGASLAFYTDTLGFAVRRGTVEEGNISLIRGDASIMLEGPTTTSYSDRYNAAIAAPASVMPAETHEPKWNPSRNAVLTAPCTSRPASGPASSTVPARALTMTV